MSQTRVYKVVIEGSNVLLRDAPDAQTYGFSTVVYLEGVEEVAERAVKLVRGEVEASNKVLNEPLVYVAGVSESLTRDGIVVGEVILAWFPERYSSRRTMWRRMFEIFRPRPR